MMVLASATTIAAEPSFLLQFVTAYEAKKIAFAMWATLSDRELHANVGMLIYVLVAVTARRSLASRWPWLAAALCEGINEYFDRIAYASWRWPDTRIDIFCTMIWPTLLFLGARSGLIMRR